MSLTELGTNALRAKRSLACTDGETRRQALKNIADALEKDRNQILAENAKDLAAGASSGLTKALLDRLMLNEARLHAIADSMREVSDLPDPLNRTLSETLRANGLLIRKISVPIGVIGIIYEARPNVTADSAALCLMSGNAVILRGGKEAICSNRAIAACMREAIAASGLDRDCVQLITDTSRESAAELMGMKGVVDLLIPRGGKGLIQSVVQNAKVPVIETGAGVCHTYIDESADLAMAVNIVFNAKASRPSVCNALECLLVHQGIAAEFLPAVKSKLDEAHVELRGDERALALLPGIVPAVESDWGKEYDDYILAVKVVDDLQQAIDHIYRCSTFHSECIITENAANAEYFMQNVDAAAVYVNASTRFTDGGEFGLGAEIGISTQKLHARGPLGLCELTSTKYMVFGKGQIR